MVPNKYIVVGRIIHPYLPGGVSKLYIGGDLTESTKTIFAEVKLKNADILVFTDNLLFEWMF